MIDVANCRHGRMMFLKNDKFIGRSLELYGESMRHEVDYACCLLGPGDVFIDVGANMGVFTIPMAKKVGKDGYGVAIEAQQFMYHILCGNLALNEIHHVQALHRAAAHMSGNVAFLPQMSYDGEENFGGVQVSSEAHVPDAEGRLMETPIATLALDDLALAKPKFIKIDVEGMEIVVLHGGRKTIERAKPYLYVEVLFDHESILRFLSDLDYEWKLHEPPLFTEDNFLNNKENVFQKEGKNIVSCNLICWHQSMPEPPDDGCIINVEMSTHPYHKMIREIKHKLEREKNKK